LATTLISWAYLTVGWLTRDNIEAEMIRSFSLIKVKDNRIDLD